VVSSVLSAVLRTYCRTVQGSAKFRNPDSKPATIMTRITIMIMIMIGMGAVEKNEGDRWAREGLS